MVPLSVLDDSNANIPHLLLILGFVPLLLSLLYVSFQKKYSKILLIFSMLMLSATGWVHFFLNVAYDEHLEADLFYMNDRFFMDGEMEDILKDYPEKAKQANPEHFKNLKP